MQDPSGKDSSSRAFNDAASAAARRQLDVALSGDVSAYLELRNAGVASTETMLWEIAAARGHIDLMRHMLADEKSVTRGLVEKTATSAAKNGRRDVIEWLRAEIGMLNAEEMTDHAGTALECGHEALAHWLAQQVLAAPLLEQKKGKLCGSILGNCILAGRMGFAGDLLDHVGDTLEPFAQTAIGTGHIEALYFLVEEGMARKKLEDGALENLLMSAIDKDFRAGVEYLCAAGADVSCFKGAALKRVIRNFDGSDFSRIELMLAHGADPHDLLELASETWDEETFAKHGAKIAAAAQALQDIAMEELSARLPGKLTPEDLRMVQAGENESALHFAARQRILDRVIVRLQPLGLSALDWDLCNAQGESVAELLCRSGHAPALFRPDLWLGRAQAAASLFGKLDEKSRAGLDLAHFLHETNMATLSLRTSPKRFKL